MQLYDYHQIFRELTPVTEFNENTGLYLHKQKNMLYTVKKEDISAKAVYDVLTTVSDPHLARVYCVTEVDGHIEVLQEYVSGISLGELLLRQGALKKDTAERLFSEICDGLYALHKKGLVHRDINPNNIIITSCGHAVIIDYGIARSYNAEKLGDTLILGTPGYAAPEQFGFSQSDARTDIYALGVLLNVMLTGELPNVRRAGGTLGKIIGKCIEIDSRQRFDSIGELKDSINKIVSYSGPADRFIAKIPGLRSKNIFVVIFALICYIIAGLLTAAIFATSGGKFVGTLVGWVFLMPIPFICFHNFLGIWDKLPYTAGSSKRSQAIVYTALGIFSILIGLIVIGSISV